MLNPTERLRVLSRLFTRPVFTALSRGGDWRLACPFLEKHSLLREGPGQALSELFDSAWRDLRQGYRNEYVYKNEIANRLIFGWHSPRTAALHVELPVSSSIVDIAVYNGTSTAYEIKTEFDSTRRLRTQTDSYCKAFEYVYVVTHLDLAQCYAHLVAESVGVMALTKGGSLRKIKVAKSNRHSFDHQVIFRCMRRDEYMTALEKLHPQLRHLPNGVIAEKAMALFGKLESEEVHSIYLDALHKRKTSGTMPRFVGQLPESLRALGCGTPLSKCRQDNLLLSLREEIQFALA